MTRLIKQFLDFFDSKFHSLLLQAFVLHLMHESDVAQSQPQSLSFLPAILGIPWPFAISGRSLSRAGQVGDGQTGTRRLYLSSKASISLFKVALQRNLPNCAQRCPRCPMVFMCSDVPNQKNSKAMCLSLALRCLHTAMLLFF